MLQKLIEQIDIWDTPYTEHTNKPAQPIQTTVHIFDN